MPATALFAASATIVLILGMAHLLLTFRGPAFRPRDPDLKSRMEAVSPGITAQTTMWKAWIGFNASHGLGAILFGLVYGYLALAQTALLMGSTFLLTLGMGTLLALLVLARAYWFRTPLLGIALSAALFAAGIVVGKA